MQNVGFKWHSCKTAFRLMIKEVVSQAQTLFGFLTGYPIDHEDTLYLEPRNLRKCLDKTAEANMLAKIAARLLPNHRVLKIIYGYRLLRWKIWIISDDPILQLLPDDLVNSVLQGTYQKQYWQRSHPLSEASLGFIIFKYALRNRNKMPCDVAICI
jgi:hypothetical protein